MTLCRIELLSLLRTLLTNQIFVCQQQILRTTIPTTSGSLVLPWALLCQPLWLTWLWKTWSNKLCPPLSSSLGFGSEAIRRWRMRRCWLRPCANIAEPSTQFTVEREINQQIAFLDVSVCRQGNGQLASKVYRKATHTERYLSSESHHPISHKKAVVKSLTDRANNIPTTSDSRSGEFKQVTGALLANGYPKRT